MAITKANHPCHRSCLSLPKVLRVVTCPEVPADGSSVASNGFWLWLLPWGLWAVTCGLSLTRTSSPTAVRSTFPRPQDQKKTLV